MSDNFTIAERNRKENPIYAPPTFPSCLSSCSRNKKEKKTFMLLLFKKKRINGINKCPILGIDIYCGVELFNAIYFFFPKESSSVCTQHFHVV